MQHWSENETIHLSSHIPVAWEDDDQEWWVGLAEVARVALQAAAQVRDNVICECGHVFSNHRRWWDESDTGASGWRCDESDGCDNFRAYGWQTEALTSIAQFDKRWTGQHVNNFPSREQIIAKAYDALAAREVEEGER